MILVLQKIHFSEISFTYICGAKHRAMLIVSDLEFFHFSEKCLPQNSLGMPFYTLERKHILASLISPFEVKVFEDFFKAI